MTTKAYVIVVIAFLFTPVIRAQVPDLVGGPMGLERVAAQSGSHNAYQSPQIDSATHSAWIQIDLGSSFPIDEIKLFPCVGNGGWYGKPYSRYRFPQRFKIETARENDAAFQSPQLFF
ncbi:MAG: hypothetical protein LBF59_05615, partial [Prevotellaceae bacterium]|nr:hypothetical protein [Prevotellaceae bacterium]